MIELHKIKRNKSVNLALFKQNFIGSNITFETTPQEIDVNVGF